MSSKARNAEKRRENEAAYMRELEDRERHEREMEQKFGALRSRLEELGLDPYRLAEYLVYLAP